MIATLWLFSILSTIMLREIECFYESPVDNFQQVDIADQFQDNRLTEKRTKPSLSIVNPLDVLRQRLLLEIARRQMRENTKQVELNRAILKNVGKRVNNFDYINLHRFANQHGLHELQPKLLKASNDERQQQQQNQQDEEEQLQHQEQQQRLQHFPHNKADDDLHIKYLYSLKYNNII